MPQVRQQVVELAEVRDVAVRKPAFHGIRITPRQNGR